MVLNKLTKRNFFENPGLSKTLAGDGAAQIVAGLIGGPPTTSYGEKILAYSQSREYIACLSLVGQQFLQSLLASSGK